MKTAPFLAAFFVVLMNADAARIAYVYDNAGRIVTADYAGTGLTRFSFDAHGNLLSRTNTDDPLPPLAGAYFGLALNAAPNATNSAPLSLTLGADGAFTGTLTLGGQRFTFRGVFAENGTTANIVIDRKGSLADLTLALALDVNGGTRRIDGTLTDGVFNSALALDLSRHGRKADAVPAGLAGPYTALFLPTETTAGIPKGAGYATANLASTGALRVAGTLADGTKVSLGSTLAGEDVWAFYTSL